MKIALVSMMDDGFFIAYVSFIKSLRINNPWISYSKIPFVIIDLGISSDIKEKMLQLYPYLIFREPQKDNYRNVDMRKTPDILRCTYYKLDMFSLEYHRIIFIDMDTTVVGSIHHLFQVTDPIAGCDAYNLQSDRMRGDVNSGVLVVNDEYLNDETYNGLLDMAKQGFSSPDQKTINWYFGRKIVRLNKIYNCEKRMVRSVKFKSVWDNRRIIHWISEKPWQEKTNPFNQGFEEIEQVWWDYYNKEITNVAN